MFVKCVCGLNYYFAILDSDSDSFTGIYIKSSGQGSMISWNVHKQELDDKDINSTFIFRKAAKSIFYCNSKYLMLSGAEHKSL